MRITAAGARTAIGASLVETATSLRAGIQRFRRAPFVDATGEAFLVAPILDMSRRLEGAERGLLIARAALADLAANAAPRWQGRRIGLVLGIEPRWPVGVRDPDGRLASWLQELERSWRAFPGGVVAVLHELGVLVRSDHVVWVAGDATSGVLALEQARAWLEQRVVDAVIVGGVSAPCEAPWLMLLDEHELTFAADRDAGAVFGEAGAFVLLESDGAGPELLGLAHEIESNSPRLGPSTLTAGLGRALSHQAFTTEGGTVDLLLDTNGREDRTKAWSFAQTRVLGSRGLVARKFEPATLLGDVGIATVPLYLGLAAQLELADTVIAVAHSIGEAAAFATLKAGVKT